MEIVSHIPIFTGERMAFGKVDGAGLDVRGAAKRAGMTPYWNYLGHRYDRSWVRSLVASEPLRITFVMREAPREGFVTSDRPPRIEGRKLIWKIGRGQKLTFRDGRARLSLLRLNSYQPVDQIVFEKLASSAKPDPS